MGLIRIGEAVNRVPDEVRELFADQPCRQIVAMRNLAAHQYDDLDPAQVWRTVTRDVPRLRDYLVDTVLPGLGDEQVAQRADSCGLFADRWAPESDPAPPSVDQFISILR